MSTSLLCVKMQCSMSRLSSHCRPHVNFICGSNGSGKSASLQAMQCCLGVKARDTGRAAKIDAFIKTGCSHASAAVTLWNTGHDAFSPTVYGSTITIERRITKSSSSFTVRNAAQQKVGSQEYSHYSRSMSQQYSHQSTCMPCPRNATMLQVVD